MKGLLLKELYLCKKHCRVYFIICLVFIAAYFVERKNELMLLYPCFLSGMIPINLLGFDEQSKFDTYAGTLPYSRAQIVSVKYIIGLGALAIIALTTTIVSLIMSNISGVWNTSDMIITLLSHLTIGLLIPLFSLPFMFKLGVNKGRIAYFISIVLVAGVVAAYASIRGSEGIGTLGNASGVIVFAIVVLLFGASWYLSVKFYEKREF